MSEYDYMDELFDAARNEPPTVPVEEMKSVLGDHVAAGGSGAALSRGMSFGGLKNGFLLSGVALLIVASALFFGFNSKTESETTPEIDLRVNDMIADRTSPENNGEALRHQPTEPETIIEQTITKISKGEESIEKTETVIKSSEGDVKSEDLIALIPDLSTPEHQVSEPVMEEPANPVQEENDSIITVEVERIEFRVTQSTSPDDLLAMAERCSKYGVRFVCSKPKWKKKLLYKFHIQLVDGRKVLRVNARHEYEKDAYHTLRFGFDVDENNATSNFYVGRRPITDQAHNSAKGSLVQ